MRLLEVLPNGGFRLTENLLDNAIPRYAILSHTWGDESQEVNFEDMVNGSGQGKAGYKKIEFCAEQAARDDLRYFWVDSCCIKKSSDSELSESLNSMFRWYKRAEKCYVYLSDVSKMNGERGDEKLRESWEIAFRKSKWFTRGWTLQELLAPMSVEFFSTERELLGDKQSLEQQVHQVTEIPIPALRGSALSQFSTEQKFGWAKSRKTTREEDWAYSLLGVFETSMPVVYGEGRRNAVRRLEKEIDDASKAKQCLRDLRITDPRADKVRIEETKGGLIQDSYHWILQNCDFKQWCNDQQSQLLWIKGDPGKGKTMLLCGIIDELKKSTAETHLLSFFYCQAIYSRINNATAVLRGLLYLLADQQPSLISHIQKQHDHAGKTLFEDANAWFALSEIFTNVLQDPGLKRTYLIIDALDECTEDLPKLLNFIKEKSLLSPRVKWLVSSRNWPSIEEQLDKAKSKAMLCLELNAESVSAAVNIYIEHKVCQLGQEKKYDDKTRDAVLQHLSSNADDTFLWVALVCQNLKMIPRWNVHAKLNTFPPGLDSLYERMMQQISNSDNSALCKRILASIVTVYEPITLFELTSIIETLEDLSDDLESLQEIVGLCGSFLTIRKDTIYFVHQSAKDYLLTKASAEIFPSGKGEIHHQIFSKSFEVMSRTLHRDIYGLCAPGYAIEQVEQPDPDPLLALRYSCIYWVDHLYECETCSHIDHKVDLYNGDKVDIFIREKFLYWLEALSLLRAISKGALVMAKLEKLIQGMVDTSALFELVYDARRFLLYYKQGIEISPLQVYTSALIFSPTNSLIRRYFREEEPKWITIKPIVGEKWTPCLQTLEGHTSFESVAFSHDSTRLASASLHNTVMIWGASSGKCLQTLKGHSNIVHSVAFSPNGARLASASSDHTVKIWDASSGKCLQTLEGHSKGVNSVAFSPNSARLASASSDHTVKIWDVSIGKCLQTLEGHHDCIYSVAFTPIGARLASASTDRTVKIWDASNGKCLQTLEGHCTNIWSVAFSPNGAQLASASSDHTVKIWDASIGKCLQTLEGHRHYVHSVAFSPDGARLASASYDRAVKIWDASSGECLQTLGGHSSFVTSVAFSPNGAWLASASFDNTVRIWDATSASTSESLQTPEGHSEGVHSVAFSPNRDRLASASASDDGIVKIWDASSGKCLQTLKGHSDSVGSVAFSPNGAQLASASSDGIVKIWNASSGKCRQTLRVHQDGYVNSITFSPNGARLASASGDSTAKVWDVSSGKCLQTLKGHRSYVGLVAFSPNGAWLASASGDATVKIWDASSGKCLQTLKGHSDGVHLVAFSPNGARLASTSYDDTVKIWDASSGECLQTLRGHSSFVESVAFSPNEARLASASDDGMVKIWDASSGECLQTVDIDYLATRHMSRVSFDPTSSYLHTEFGTLALRVSPPSSLSSSDLRPNVTHPESLPYQGWGLSSDGNWITYNSENWVWLPFEYRPLCLAVSGKTIGVGSGTGKVWICNF